MKKKHYSYRTLHRGKHFNFKIASNKTTSGPQYFCFWNRFRVEIRVQVPWRLFRIRLSSHSSVLRFSVTMGRLLRNRPTIISIRSKSLFLLRVEESRLDGIWRFKSHYVTLMFLGLFMAIQSTLPHVADIHRDKTNFTFCWSGNWWMCLNPCFISRKV